MRKKNPKKPPFSTIISGFFSTMTRRNRMQNRGSSGKSKSAPKQKQGGQKQDNDIAQEIERFQNMTREDKRKLYKCRGNYKTLS